MIQFGNGEETEFTDIGKFSFLQVQHLHDSEFPANQTYKYHPHIYAEINVRLNSDLKKISRKNDSFFDWLGDWGGLLDGLNFIGRLILNPYSLYALQSRLAGLLIRFVPSTN